jgi:uncharacterized protein (DUF169 family)
MLKASQDAMMQKGRVYIHRREYDFSGGIEVYGITEVDLIKRVQEESYMMAERNTKFIQENYELKSEIAALKRPSVSTKKWYQFWK